MNERLLPLKEIVSAWCEGHRAASQVTRLAEMASPQVQILLFWMYPRDGWSNVRFELLERVFLEAGEELPPGLPELFLGSVRQEPQRLRALATDEAAPPLIRTLAADRADELALRGNEAATELLTPALLERLGAPAVAGFFQTRAGIRAFRRHMKLGRVREARDILDEQLPAIDPVCGEDVFECLELIHRLALRTAEGDSETLAGYLALRQDTRLFDHDRAVVTHRAAELLSRRQQFASALALWLHLVHEDQQKLSPRIRRTAVLSLARDLIQGGDYQTAIRQLDTALAADNDEEFAADAIRLQALAHIENSDLFNAESLVSRFAERPQSLRQRRQSLDVFVRVRLLRTQSNFEDALDLADHHLAGRKGDDANDRWLPALARERVRILRESLPGHPSLVAAANHAIHIAAIAQDPNSLRDVYFTLAMHYSDKTETGERAIEACRDAEGCVRTIMETLSGDRDILFRLLPDVPQNKIIVSAMLSRLVVNARRGHHDVFELIRSLVRQAQGATDLLAALQLSQRRIERILATLPIVFWTSFGAARNFRLSRAEGAVAEVLGGDLEDLEAGADNWLERVHSEDRAKVELALREVEHSLGGRIVEFRRTDPIVGEKWIEMQIRPVIGESHEDGVLYGIMSDTTERQLLQQSAIRNQKTELLGHVVGNVTHEFNNVIGGILSAATLLSQMLPADDPHLEIVDAIERSAVRGRDLTAKLVALTTQGAMRRQRVDLIGAVEDAVELARRIVSSEITIDVRTSPAKLPVLLSRESLTRCLLELLRNAAEAGTDAQTVTLTINRSSENAEVLIQDQGHGMSEETAGRAFDPFFTTKNKSHHRGLGLSMAEKIANENDATLSLESQLRHGTTVTFSIPVCEGPIDDKNREKSRERLMSRGGRLLVIDDDPQVLRVSSAILERAGFEVVCARDGQEGIEEFDKAPNSWSLVISDIRMPRLDGVAVIHQLRSRSKTLPILLMTGYSESSPIQFAEVDDFLEVIYKPFTAGSFLDRAASLLPDEPRA